MKKLVLIFAAAFFASINLSAQLKIGYVDSESIIENLPDAQDAQKKIDIQIEDWQKELNKMKDEWQKKFDDYERRKLIMSNDKRAEVEKKLITLETNMENYRQSKFGSNGELFKKQEELMKPIHNQIFNAIEEISKEKDLDFVFDRSGDLIFLYAKEKYDITPEVLRKLQ